MENSAFRREVKGVVGASFGLFAQFDAACGGSLRIGPQQFGRTGAIGPAIGCLRQGCTRRRLKIALAAATAQLVQASRVKSSLMSKTQEKLEIAAKAVTDACRALVKQVKAITAKQMLGKEDGLDYSTMPNQEFKIREMEAQVRSPVTFRPYAHKLLRSRSSRSSASLQMLVASSAR